jgi:prolyl-tRNA synthetase
MRLRFLLSKRSAEAPKDARLPSHRLLLRGGYVKRVGQGLFASLPLALRVRAKIERILREEMDAIGGQEIAAPVVAPVEVGARAGLREIDARFEDRAGHLHVLSSGRQDVVVDAVGASVESYRQLPLMVYQLQAQFRDVARPFGGLLRLRELTMLDACSFHRTPEDLEAYYELVHEVYGRVLLRMGLEAVTDVESALEGGALAHHFVALSEQGDTALVLCDACGYRATRDAARGRWPRSAGPDVEAPQKVPTPGVTTIAELAQFLGIEPYQTGKAVLCSASFSARAERPVAAFVRGDLEVNFEKLRRAVGARELRPLGREEVDALGLSPGSVGPLGLPSEHVLVVVDRSLGSVPSVAVGANEQEHHLTGVALERDLKPALPGGLFDVDVADVGPGSPCPTCGALLGAAAGFEVGRLQQHDAAHGAALGFEYLEEDGKPRSPAMASYAIGVERVMASVVEAHHDDHGPIWPISVAPFEVAVCCVQARKEGVTEAGETIYQQLRAVGVEAVLDDREVNAGAMFADADLVGAPVRVVVSPRNLKAGEVELQYRLPRGLAEDPTLAAALPSAAPLAEGAAAAERAVRALSEVYDRSAASL